MRVHAPLDDIIGGKTTVRVLRALSLFPDKEFTGRELATVAGGAPSKVIDELARLRILGLVSRKTFGRTHAWRVNKEHVIFRMFAPIFESEHKLSEQLQKEIHHGTRDPRIARVILFGSFARGDENSQSDIDLLVLTKRASDIEHVRTFLDSLAIQLRNQFGLRLSPIIHAEKELPALRRKPFLARVAEDGRVIRGEPL